MKTTDLREAAQQALELLGTWAKPPACLYRVMDNLRTALAQEQAEPPANQCGETCERAKLCAACARALEEPTGKQDLQVEPVQEPVAWIHTDPDKPRVKFLEWRENEPGYRGRWTKTPLYTAPPRCPNCASLEAQNNELDRKLAEMEQADPVPSEQGATHD